MARPAKGSAISTAAKSVVWKGAWKGDLDMQRLKLLGTFLMTGSCLAIATIAAAEPVSPQPPAKKHAECEGSKMKTACNRQADVKDFVKGIQVPPAPTPPADGQTAVPNSRQELQPAKEDSAGAKPPAESVEKMAPRA
jgi:hypothetical protein